MQKKYKILLSAYACEPNKGSEQGVGWNWAIEVAKRGHYVWVLTRENNKELIDSYFRENPKPENLNFVYYDLPRSFRFWKKGGRGVHLYYFLWQIAVLKTGLNLHKSIKFDFVHHISFVTIHQPSFLFLIPNLAFFYGPTGGGDYVPRVYLRSFPFKRRIKELFLYLQNSILKYDLVRRAMFNRSELIFCNTNQTIGFLPKTVYSKIIKSLAIGVSIPNQNSELQQTNKEVLRVLFVGNFLHWKGLHLVLKVSDEYMKSKNIKFTLLGKGNLKEFDYQNQNIDIINWVPQNEIYNIYNSNDLFIFPSFRDSGGMVVLEAMASGLPVICLDLGGPGQIVNETCGRVISTKNKTENEIIENISDAIQELTTNKQLLESLRKGAIQRASEFTWDKTVGHVYQEIENYMSKLQKDGEA